MISIQLDSRPDAEISVLGSLMIVGKSAVPRVQAVIGTEDFAARAHELIYNAICSVAARGVDPDLVLVAAELEGKGLLDAAGGAAYVSMLVDRVPDVENVVEYARVVKASARMRKLQRLRA